MLFRNAYFRSLVHSSQKLWPQLHPCILPCKIGDSQNLMKERYLSKTPFLTFVYLSKYSKSCFAYLEIPNKVFMKRSNVHQVHHVKIIVVSLHTPRSPPTRQMAHSHRGGRWRLATFPRQELHSELQQLAMSFMLVVE